MMYSSWNLTIREPRPLNSWYLSLSGTFLS